MKNRVSIIWDDLEVLIDVSDGGVRKFAWEVIEEVMLQQKLLPHFHWHPILLFQCLLTGHVEQLSLCELFEFLNFIWMSLSD